MAYSKASDLVKLLTSLIRENPDKTRAEYLVAFEQRLRTPDYDTYLSAAIAKAFSLFFVSADAAANPESVSAIDKKARDRSASRQADDDEVERLKMQMISNLLDFLTPIGKPLRNCTGRECGRMQGFFGRVSEAIRADDKVGDVLSNGDLRELFQRSPDRRTGREAGLHS